MRGHVKPVTRQRLDYIWEIVKQGPTEVGYAYFRARRRRKNVPDEDIWLSEGDRLPLETPGSFDLSDEDLAGNRRVLDEYARADRFEIRTLQWLIPWTPTVFLGGVYTILRFAAHFQRSSAASTAWSRASASTT